MELVFELLLIGGLIFFTAWLSHLTFKLTSGLDAIDQSDAQLEEIRESVELVAQILSKLPEMLPSFHMNNSPTDFLKPIVEAFVGNLGGPKPLMSYDTQPRDAGGQYGTQTESSKETAQAPTDD
jgi:NADH:ubiquinone oxidoreductase subunit D